MIRTIPEDQFKSAISFMIQLSTISTKLYLQNHDAAVFSLVESEFRESGDYLVFFGSLSEDGSRVSFSIRLPARDRVIDLPMQLDDFEPFKKVVHDRVTISEKARNLIDIFKRRIGPEGHHALGAVVDNPEKRCMVSPIFVNGKCVAVASVVGPCLGEYLIPSWRNFAEAVSITLEQNALRKEQELLKARLKISQELLVAERNELKEKNLALKVLLEQIETEKKNVTGHFLSNVDKAILPLIAQLEKKAGAEVHGDIVLLKQNLDAITSPFRDRMSSLYGTLSPRELEVCGLVKNGLSSKGIAERLSISPQTVHRYREHIRKKLGLAHKNVNLTVFLNSEAFNK